MINDCWLIRWKYLLADSYTYGSTIEVKDDKSIVYKNRLMPPGTVIHKWFSQTNFQAQRIEPTLPLIDGEAYYSLDVDIDYNSKNSKELMLRIVFYDRYDEEAESMVVRSGRTVFKPSIKTYSYSIELINGGNADFTFRSMMLKEVSKEEYDAEQERIENLKEYTKEGKKKRRKNKKAKRQRTLKSDERV